MLDGAIKRPKMQPVKVNVHREIIGVVKSITVSLSKTGKFYASILVDDGVATPSPIHTIGKVVGIDLGLSHYAIGSNGEKTANPRFVKRAEKNLRRKQRQLSRKAKGSANRALTRGTPVLKRAMVTLINWKQCLYRYANRTAQLAE